MLESLEGISRPPRGVALSFDTPLTRGVRLWPGRSQQGFALDLGASAWASAHLLTTTLQEGRGFSLDLPT